MSPASFEALASAVQGRLRDIAFPWPWSGRVRIDSREIQPGDLFIALPGSQRDGHEFVADAFSKGAVLAIVQTERAAAVAGPKLMVRDPQIALQDLALWQRRRMEALIIGVTGSVGKTTTRELIHSAVSGQHHGVRSRQNFNNEIGLPLSLLDIQADHEFGVLELGAAAIGDIAQLTALAQPEIGVITAIGSAHLETFGSVEGIMQGKGELLESLPTGGFAVLPGDCPKLRSMAKRAKCPVIFVGENVENRLRVSGIERVDGGLRFRFDGQSYHLPILGRHHVTNALCALAIGREIGISPATLAEGLAEFTPLKGRLHASRIGAWTVLDDTYNASPQAFAAALETLAELSIGPPLRRMVIAGDMLELGSSAPLEHRQLGTRIGRLKIDRLLVTGRYADDVAFGAMSAGMPPHHIVSAQDWDTLLYLLECWLEPDDAVLVKGSRGMRMERVIDWMTNVSMAADPRKCA